MQWFGTQNILFIDIQPSTQDHLLRDCAKMAGKTKWREQMVLVEARLKKAHILSVGPSPLRYN